MVVVHRDVLAMLMVVLHHLVEVGKFHPELLVLV
jgi:hypothetical protein